MSDEYYLYFMLNEQNKWELHGGFNPERIPYSLENAPSLQELKYKEGDILEVVVKGIKRTCIVKDVLCCLHLIGKQWIIYYDLSWTGSGHTHGYFTIDEINK